MKRADRMVRALGKPVRRIVAKSRQEVVGPKTSRALANLANISRIRIRECLENWRERLTSDRIQGLRLTEILSTMASRVKRESFSSILASPQHF